MAGAGLALLAVVVPAGPATADATITITSPSTNQQLDTDRALIQAGVSLDSRTTMGSVHLRLQQLGSKRPDIGADATASGGAVSFDVPLPYNGAYRATVTADWQHAGTLGLGSHSGTATDGPVDFLVAKYPAPPADVKTAVDAASRAVTVVWKANAEPDMLFYVVQRAKGTSNDFTVLGKATPTETTYIDSSTAEAGGDYRYQVVAVRNGVNAGEGLSSDPSTVSTANVPDPPPPPTAPPGSTVAGAPGTGSAAGTTGTASSLPANSPGALTTSGTVDLSGFKTVRSQTRSATPRTVPLPDPGFEGTLPFATPDPTAALEEGDLGEQAVESPLSRELGAGSSADERIRTMAFFAGGLLATVLLMHVLWVKSEVKRVPLEAIDPEGPLPMVAGAHAGPGKAKAGRSRRKRVTAGAFEPDSLAYPRLEDISAPDFAPVVVAAAGRPRGSGNRRQKVSSGV